MTRYEDHAVFELEGGEERSWTLFVIDDDWQSAVTMYDRARTESFSSSAVDQVLLNFTGARGIYRTATALLPVYSRNLRGLARLIIGDFKRDLNSFSWLETQLSQRGLIDTSYLIDLNDWESESLLGEGEARGLANLGVPLWRMAYLTVGARGRDEFDLETILKDSFDLYGQERLSTWFNRVKGEIDYSFFLTNLPHNPSGLKVASLSALQSLVESEKIQEQVKRDKYGVWAWFTDVHQGTNLEGDTVDSALVKYNYLCGKSFLRSASDHRFPYPALRGFLLGLAKTFQITLEEVQLTLPTEPDQDNECCFGFCHTASDVKFQQFTICLWRFIDTFHNDTGGTLKVQFITLFTQPDSVELILHLDGSLPESIHQGTGKGLVTQAYASLARCFSAESFLLSETHDAIKIVFIRTLDN